MDERVEIRAFMRERTTRYVTEAQQTIEIQQAVERHLVELVEALQTMYAEQPLFLGRLLYRLGDALVDYSFAVEGGQKDYERAVAEATVHQAASSGDL